jgi:outer membrane protein assembly factor BamB
MALPPDELRAYLGADLRRVPSTMTIVALTHDPPLEPAIDVLRSLGVDYVLTGHTHTNRIVDHGGIIELNTEPFLMGGLDFTPAGYRVVMIERGRLSSYHRTVVDEPFVALVSPREGDCLPPESRELLVAAELGAGASVVSARVDCATAFELRQSGGWLWRGELPSLAAGDHLLEIDALSPTGAHTTLKKAISVCRPASIASAGADWPQIGGNDAHTGSVPHELATPLTSRWVAALGNHVLTSSPIVAGGTVYVATTDLADGSSGGVVAIDLTSGAVRWRVPTAKPIRGGVAFAGGTVFTTQIDGEVLALDAATGAVRWRRAVSAGLPPQAGAVFSPPTFNGFTIYVCNQRASAALDATTGDPRWIDDPVPYGFNSQTAAAIAVGHGLAVGTFQRTYGGVVAWDAETGVQRWRYEEADSIAINATPVIGESAIYLVNGITEVIALDFEGHRLWRTKLDAEGFDWGQASVGTPALDGDTLIVPTLYGSLVAIDTQTGAERWRYRARPGPLRGTHYRGKSVAAFAASPIVTGGIVWVADASGVLSAHDVRTGLVRWFTELPSPVMAGLAVSGDWLVIASYDGTVRAMTPGVGAPPRPPTAELCPTNNPDAPLDAGCCNSGAGRDTAGLLAIALAVALLRRRQER